MESHTFLFISFRFDSFLKYCDKSFFSKIICERVKTTHREMESVIKDLTGSYVSKRRSAISGVAETVLQQPPQSLGCVSPQLLHVRLQEPATNHEQDLDN